MLSRRTTYVNLRSKQQVGDRHKESPRHSKVPGAHRDLATTYSPTNYGSTIGAAGLNGSVRNGKRWDPRAVATKKSVTRGQPEQNCTGRSAEGAPLEM